MINYRYRILRKLGVGGSGEVYSVEDALKNRRQSAMKILYGNDASDRDADKRFRDEVSVLATLHHPNLVQVSDFGIIRQSDEAALQGRRFFTMEYLQGSTALEWWRKSPPRQDHVRVLQEIALQALGALSFIHRQGIIHFDIKPDNLLLLSSSEKREQVPLLKLMDFGFHSRQNAAVEFPLRGTLEYTAPELLRREAFDHRVDLYSLGATLYHLIEDRCPFEADEPVELIKKVLTAEPTFRRCADEGFSSMLSFLETLLQKDPARRFASASEAARALLEGDRGVSGLAFVSIPKPGFVGREREKALIGSAIASLQGDPAGTPHVAIEIAGPEGIGKTALLGEMARSARAADIPVFDVDVDGQSLPFSGMLSLLPLLRSEGMARIGVSLIESFADVIDGGSVSDGDHARELRLRWFRERDNVVETQARFINRLSLLFPFMLIVDDADLLDAESREVLRLAARDTRPGRLLILAAAPGVQWLGAQATRVQLEELDAQSVSAMTASTLPTGEMSELIGTRLFELFGGSPAIIGDALLSVSGLLPLKLPSESADITGLVEKFITQLPRDIDELLFIRYSALDRGQQLTLEILSCFALPVRLDIIQAVLPFQSQRTAAYLALLQAEGIVASFEDGQRISLRHARLKSMVYAAIQESRRESHLFIASTLEALPGARTFADLQEIAYQFSQAGSYPASSRWLEAAGDEGIRIGANQRAKELFIRAVDNANRSSPPDPGRLNLKLAHALFVCGDYHEAVALAENELGKNRPDVGACTALHKTAGLAQSRLGHNEEAKRHIVAALESAGDAAETIELRQELVGVEIALGNFAEAEGASMIQLARAKDLANPQIIASIHTDLGIATFYQNHLDQSAGHFENALKIYTASGMHAHRADAMLNIANVLSAKGEVVRAIEWWTDALKMSQEHGTMNQQAQIQNNLGIAHFKLKRFREAEDFYESAKAIFARLDSSQGKAFVLTNLGEVSFAQGKYERALALWEDAQRLYREMDDGQGQVETRLQLAQVHLVLGAVDSAGTALDDAEALINDKKLAALRSPLLFQRGMHMVSRNDYGAARLFFTQSEQSSDDGAESERRLLIRVRVAECDFRLGRHVAAATEALDTANCGERMKFPQIVAETSFLLGMIAIASPSSVSEKPLPLFRKGFEAIAKEPVSELTWRLALALGKEYSLRGQRHKTIELYTKSRLVLLHFLGQFSSSELKNSYLMVENRQQALADLDAYLKR